VECIINNLQTLFSGLVCRIGCDVNIKGLEHGPVFSTISVDFLLYLINFFELGVMLVHDGFVAGMHLSTFTEEVVIMFVSGFHLPDVLDSYELIASLFWFFLSDNLHLIYADSYGSEFLLGSVIMSDNTWICTKVFESFIDFSKVDLIIVTMASSFHLTVKRACVESLSINRVIFVSMDQH
jgi:hypothetical protein